MPISINKAYRNLSRKGLPGRVKTREYRNFEEEVIRFEKKNQDELERARKFAKQVKPGLVLQMTYLFRFHDIFMKNDSKISLDHNGKFKTKGTPKINDTSNRIKVLEDVLAKILGVDDSWFFAGKYSKRQEPLDCFPETVDIVLELRPIDENGDPLHIDRNPDIRLNGVAPIN